MKDIETIKEIYIEENLNKINANTLILERIIKQQEPYPALCKIIAGRIHYLIALHQYAMEKSLKPLYQNLTGDGWTTNREEIFEKDIEIIFYGSVNYFSTQFGGSISTWNRDINLFVTLGLIKKHNINELNMSCGFVAEIRKATSTRLGIKNKKIKEINIYSIPYYSDIRLTEAEAISNTLLSNGFKMNAFSKIYLIKVFGSDFANCVFPDKRGVTKYSDYVLKQIIKIINKEINRKGYVTKDEILNKTTINDKKVKTQEYGFTRNSKKQIISREFDRNIPTILNDLQLKYSKANIQLKNKFKLKGYVYILFKE